MVFAALSLAGCDVGAIPGGGSLGTDAAGGTDAQGGTDGSAAALCVNRGTAGVAHQHAGGGTHAGEACIVGGCHAAGGGGPTFSAAGTVYKADGTTPNGGAAVRLVSGGTTVKAFTDNAGNFFLEAAVTFPAQTNVSACPDTTPMSGSLAAGGGGNCNASGCHAPGGGQGVIKFQ